MGQNINTPSFFSISTLWFCEWFQSLKIQTSSHSGCSLKYFLSEREKVLYWKNSLTYDLPCNQPECLALGIKINIFRNSFIIFSHQKYLHMKCGIPNLTVVSLILICSIFLNNWKYNLAHLQFQNMTNCRKQFGNLEIKEAEFERPIVK